MGKRGRGDDPAAGGGERGGAVRGGNVGIDAAAQHDDSVRRTARAVPGRKTLLQRIEQPISDRRKSTYSKQHDGGDQELATKAHQSRFQQDRADQAEADQEVRRQQHDP